ncbi:MAG: HD-GYP domain-containing protein [Desulfofustis sp.]|nr:HD-GYP domain-containing protein [Desulfofustis sp.]
MGRCVPLVVPACVMVLLPQGLAGLACRRPGGADKEIAKADMRTGMCSADHAAGPADSGYFGRILHTGAYSAALKKRVAEGIACYRAFKALGNPAILYIAAWERNHKRIWYEYTSDDFPQLFGYEPHEVNDILRKSIIDRRIYRYPEAEMEVHKEIKTSEEISTVWHELRAEGERVGSTEAVYKIITDRTETIWLKDQATVEVYEQDNISLSLGVLTIISKEMEAEDQLKRHHDFLEAIVQARTLELTNLNRQQQREIEKRRMAQERLSISNRQLQKSLDEIVNAMSLTLEERDPYTAGHQRRTATLSLAIGKLLGLQEDELHGLRMAGLIHDMGKIAVPGEILSKPGNLNEAEMQLIKRHPQVAYDILKQIDFPWPVDRIVLQHHEKLDGSGYPQGLKGGDILLEARILCVADVVETMETHRPYRPSLGRQAALEEIGRFRGILYDPQVVDACLTLLRERDFDYSTG